MQDWVFLVPGFAASHLWRTDFAGDRQVKIWLSQLDLALYGLSRLDVAEDVSPPVLDRVKPGDVLTEVYQPFLATMARAGIPVYTHTYDWRADLTVNGARMAEVIEAHVGSQASFTIVTHSAGGLVAMDCMNRLSDAALRHVKRLVTVACPWRGSFRTLELLAGVHETVLQIASPNLLLGPGPYLRRVMEAVKIIAGWDGVYDLLPMPDLMAKYPPLPGQDWREPGYWDKVNPHFSHQKYAEATTRRPINLAVPPGIVHRNVAGVGAWTSGPNPTVVDGRPDHFFRSLEGDGTVPLFSATSPGTLSAEQSQVEADHEQFLNSFNFRWRLLRWMDIV